MPQPISTVSNSFPSSQPNDEIREINTRIERDEIVSLEDAVKLNTRPFEKLKEAAAAIEHDREAWAKSEELINESETLSRIPVDEQKRLKQAFREILSRSQPDPEPTVQETPSIKPKLDTPESDAYLEKTAALIARKLAGIMNEGQFTEKVYHLGELEEQKRVMAKHMIGLVDENQSLRKEVHILRKELDRFTPAALGLYQKK